MADGLLRIGFSGTRQGMTADQASAFKEVLRKLIGPNPEVVEFHHGMCAGSDCQAEEIARRVIVVGLIVVGWPGVDAYGNPKNRGECHPDVIMGELPFLVRNERIAMLDAVTACPETREPKMRGSGTWQTIRRARAHRTDLYKIFPSGVVEPELGVA